MSLYASETEVPAERSRQEIERTLLKYGATSFVYGFQQTTAVIMFEMKGRRIKFNLPLPDRNSKDITHTPKGQRRSGGSLDAALKQSERQRWRALALAVKAKLESVESGITTFEEEFMAHIVLPNGSTVGAWMSPQIQAAYTGGKMPPMLGLGKGS